MGLSEGDYLKWYNDEITRYRNIEWKISGYSIAFSYATIVFSKRPEIMNLFPNSKLSAAFLVVFVVSLLLAELHVHERLNQFRAQRDALLRSNVHHGEARGTLFGAGWRDIAYLIGFLGFPILMACLATSVLLANP